MGERDYRDRDADAIDVAERGAEKEQRNDRVALRPSRDSRRGLARSCRLAHDAIELRQRDAQKKDARGKAPASLTNRWYVCSDRRCCYLPTAWRTVLSM